MTGCTEQSKNRILVLGGYLEDIQVYGRGHRASITNRPGGSAYNVAFCLSKLGLDVLFLGCFDQGENRDWPFESLRVDKTCAHGKFLYSGREVLAVQRPTRPALVEELVDLLREEKFSLVYATLEIGVAAAMIAREITCDYRLLDPSPQLEFTTLEDFESFDFILANDHMELEDRKGNLLVKAGSSGVIYAGHKYSPPARGKDKFGSGDLFGAVFSRGLLKGLAVEKAVREAVRESSNYCLSSGTLAEYMFNTR